MSNHIRRKRLLADAEDPSRRLLAAVVLQAAIDALYSKDLLIQVEGREFLFSEDGRLMLAAFLDRSPTGLEEHMAMCLQKASQK